jgi:putative membrane protein
MVHSTATEDGEPHGWQQSVGWRQAAAWMLLSIYLALVVSFAWNPTPFAQALAAIGILSGFPLAYGWRAAFTFPVICAVTTFAIENTGVTTGLMFGHYHF